MGKGSVNVTFPFKIKEPKTVIFETSGTFNPSDYGLNVGDEITVVVVGGGAAGGSDTSSTGPLLYGGDAGKGSKSTSASYNSSRYSCGGGGGAGYGGGGGGAPGCHGGGGGQSKIETLTLSSANAIAVTIGSGGKRNGDNQNGGSTSFGNYVTSIGGKYPTKYSTGAGKGGSGNDGGSAFISSDGTTNSGYYYGGGGGGGGYIIGIPFYGGKGGDAGCNGQGLGGGGGAYMDQSNVRNHQAGIGYIDPQTGEKLGFGGQYYIPAGDGGGGHGVVVISWE